MTYKVTFLSVNDVIEMNKSEFDKLVQTQGLVEFVLERNRQSDIYFTIYNGAVIQCNNSDKK